MTTENERELREKLTFEILRLRDVKDSTYRTVDAILPIITAEINASVRAALERVCDAVTIEPAYPGAVELKGLRIYGFAIKGKNMRTGAKAAERAERLKENIRKKGASF